MDKEKPELLAPSQDLEREARDFVALFRKTKNNARVKTVALNAGLIFYVAGNGSIGDGVRKAEGILKKGSGFETMEKWVQIQNRDPQKGIRKLNALWN